MRRGGRRRFGERDHDNRLQNHADHDDRSEYATQRDPDDERDGNFQTKTGAERHKAGL
jgi:hypothetical protein